MQKVHDLHKELAAQQADYHEQSDRLSEEDRRARTADIQTIRREIADTISEGAGDCPDCGSKPHGMLKRVTEEGVEVYEVGCLQCPDHRARGGSPQVVVEKWNAGNWVKGRAQEEIGRG